MEAISNNISPKRKLEDSTESELSNKRHCKDDSEQVENLNSVLKSNDCTNGIEESEDVSKLNSVKCITDNTVSEVQKSSPDETNLKKEINNEEGLNLSKDDVDIDVEVEVNTDEQLLNNPDSNTNALQAAERTTDLNDPNTNDEAPSTNSQTIQREICRYGDKCYRLNKEHKVKFAHPGDNDYNVLDNRPECPYGLKCYRKNPQHKLDYKHTQTKRKQTMRNVRSNSPAELSDWEEDSMEESIDESDYDPSFIDDESLEEYESDFKDEE